MEESFKITCKRVQIVGQKIIKLNEEADALKGYTTMEEITFAYTDAKLECQNSEGTVRTAGSN